MKVLSIDPSFTATAWSIWENEKLYDFGVISSSKDLTTPLRLKYILDNLRKVIIENEITQVVIEGMSLGGVSNSSRMLAGLFYGVQLLCLDLNIPCEEISPKSVKKIWSGSGNASKVDMETACPEYLIKVIESSPFKTINKGRRDLIDSFAIYKSWVELYGNLLSKN